MDPPGRKVILSTSKGCFQLKTQSRLYCNKTIREKHPLNASAAQNTSEKWFQLFPISNPFFQPIKSPSCFSFVVLPFSHVHRLPLKSPLQDFTSHIHLPAPLRWHLATSNSCDLTLQNVGHPGRGKNPCTSSPRKGGGHIPQHMSQHVQQL